MAITCRLILRCVAEHFGSSVLELTSERRPRHLTRQRQAYCWLARELTGRSLPVIARALGGRDHTTIHHYLRQIEYIAAADMSVRLLLNTLKTEVLAAEAVLKRLGVAVPTELDPVELADRLMNTPLNRLHISTDELQILGHAVLNMQETILTMDAELASLRANQNHILTPIETKELLS